MNKCKPVGEIGEGSFSDVLKTLSHRDGKYYACKHMKQHFESMEQVHNLREIQTLRRLSPYPNSFLLHEVVLFQPLFPGFNELDQISKIHDVIGTSANKTLNKFKQAHDTQALALYRKLRLLGNTSGQVPLHLWQISKES